MPPTALAKRGISAGVLHVPTIKPFDAEAVAEFAASRRPASSRRRTMSSSAGSRASSSRRCSTRGVAKKVTRIGLPDRYIECGSVPTLQATLRADDRRPSTETIAALA